MSKDFDDARLAMQVGLLEQAIEMITERLEHALPEPYGRDMNGIWNAFVDARNKLYAGDKE